MYERTPGAKSNGGVVISKSLSPAKAMRLAGVPVSAIVVAPTWRARNSASSVRLTSPETEMPRTMLAPGSPSGIKSTA